MRRTKETFNSSNANYNDRAGFSGCREFSGEDLEFDSRTQYYKNQQRVWLDQQINEKEMMRQKELHEENLYAKQEREVTRMRQMLEEDFKNKKHAMQHSIKDENIILALQKKDREAQEKFNRLHEEREEITYSLERGKSKPFRGSY